MRRSSRVLLSAAALLLGIDVAPRAQALSAFEAFDYGATAAESVDGRNGGFGWSGPWIGVDPGFATMGSWWPLDGAGGDVGPLASHGVEANTAYVADTPVPWSSNSLNLTSGSYVDLSPHVAKYQRMTRGTVSMWIKTTSTTPRMAMLSFSNRASVKFKGRHCSFMLLDGDAALEMRGDIHSYNFELTTGVKVNDGSWHHLAYTSHGDGWVRIYVDGVEKAFRNEGFIGYVLGCDTAQVGRASFLGNEQYEYTGQIDDLAIWGDELSAADVQSLANAQVPPVALLGPQTDPGPDLQAASLGSATFPSGAFTGTGLASAGNRLQIDSGLRAVRPLTVPINFEAKQTVYMSCLLRRDDRGMPTTAAEIQLTADQVYMSRFGWSTAGEWTLGLEGNMFSGGVPMADKTTYFCILKMELNAGIDTIYFKAYAPGDTVPPDDSAISGVGAGPNNWFNQRSQNRREVAEHLLITPVEGPNGEFNSSIIIDEIRIGPNWQVVTGYDYGSSCFGLQIGRTNRPMLGTSNFSVDLAGAAAQVPAFLILGRSGQFFAGSVLPLGLTSIGSSPQCFLNASLDSFVAGMTDGGGTLRIPFPIPNDPLLFGTAVFTQWVAADPSVPVALKAGFSAGMLVQVGS